MQVEIKFKRTGSHSVYGNFGAGDVIRCDEALAAFYVKDGVAKYVNVEQPKVEKPAPEETKPKRKKAEA